MKKLCGIIPAIASPCDEHGRFLEDTFAALARHLYHQGVHGLYVCGTTGDGYKMTVAERKRATAIALAVSRDCGGHVIPHVGANRTADALVLAEHAAELGAAAIASRPPMDRRPAQWPVYYSQLARAARLPLLVYHIPALTAHKSTADELLRLLDIEGVIGLKFSDYDLFLMQRLLLARPHITVFNGNDEILVHGLLCGAHGGIGMTYNLFPKLFVNLYQAVATGKLVQALKLQKCYLPFLDLALKYGLFPVFDQLMREQGFGPFSYRRPRQILDKKAGGRLMKELKPVMARINATMG